MFIETTFMRYGHGKASIIGKTWACSLHVAVASIDLDRVETIIVQQD